MPGLKTEVIIQTHFRGDVHASRKKPGKDPVPRDVRLSLAPDSSGKWQMSGQYSASGATYSLAGGGSLPLEMYQGDHNLAHMFINGSINTGDVFAGRAPDFSDMQFHLHISGGKPEGTLTIENPQGPPIESGYPIPQSSVLTNQVFELDQSFSIQPGKRQPPSTIGLPGTVTLEWELIKANYPPDLNNPPHATFPQNRAGLLRPGFLCDSLMPLTSRQRPIDVDRPGILRMGEMYVCATDSYGRAFVHSSHPG